MPNPSFSAAVLDRSRDVFSFACNLFRNGFIFTLFLIDVDGDGGAYASRYRAGGLVSSW